MADGRGVIAVTGASRGLGAAISLELARRGFVVGCLSRRGRGPEDVAVPADVAPRLINLTSVMRTNATAVLAVCREAYPHLVARGGGIIVNLGSFFDKLGVPRNLAYSASKAAVGAITRCLAVEWAPRGITVVNVAPGYVETDFNREFLGRPEVQEFLRRRIPVRRTGTATEVARLVAMLFTEQIGYLTGETIYADGGHGIAH
jgi:NAD(P)-dependent dehydrogenase (short-subunit alcohol dehydrogenase family)